MAYGFNEDKSKYNLPKLLWENPNPSSFPAQTITLNDDLTNYDFIEIIIVHSTTAFTHVSCKVPVAANQTELVSTYPYQIGDTNVIYINTRNAQWNANAPTSITFGDGNRKLINAGNITAMTNTTYAIPVAVIGHKY